MKKLFSAALISAVAIGVLAAPLTLSSAMADGKKKASPCDEIKEKKAHKSCVAAEKAKAKAAKKKS